MKTTPSLKLIVSFVLSVIKRIILQCCHRSLILPNTRHGTSSYSCHMSSISGITVLSFDWLCYRAIQINNQILILVNCVLIWWFWGFYLSIVSSSLGPSLISYSFLCLSWILLDCVVVNRISSHFSWINISTYKFINYFSSLFQLFRI